MLLLLVVMTHMAQLAPNHRPSSKSSGRKSTWWRALGWIAAMPAMGCGAHPDPGGGGGATLIGAGGASAQDSTPDAPCYGPVGKTAAVAECAPTRSCFATPVAISVDGRECDGGGCSWTFAENVGDTLTYTNGRLWVFLRFRTSIRGATTTEELSAALDQVAFLVHFPVEGGAAGLTAMANGPGWGGPETTKVFDTFELVGGRLHVEISAALDAPYAWVDSPDARCVGGDVGGACICTYGGRTLASHIEIDAPAQLP
jgi:hypothetical protein